MSILQTKGNVEDVFKVLDNHNINSAFILDNKLKALNIIKEKCVGNHNLGIVAMSNNYSEYCAWFTNTYDGTIIQRLTQQEFDLLKEVLE